MSAQSGIDIGAGYAENIGLGNRNPKDIIVGIIQVFLGFLALLAVILIMYSGYMMMVSGGDPSKVEKAKGTLKNAVIGLLIILASWGIVLFVITWWNGENGPGGGRGGGRGNGNIGQGLSALGSCAIVSVYPEPGQDGVPRNTSIVITFRDEVASSTLAGGDNLVISSNFDLHKTVDPASTMDNIQVRTNDNFTFVFTPQEYLGSESEEVSYTIRLSSDILKLNGGASIFDDCRADYFEWQFTVSTVLDLDPPQVDRVFPIPDNERDTVENTGPAVQARGTISVIDLPGGAVPASAGEPVPEGGSPDAVISGTYNCREDGILTVAVRNGTPMTVDVSGVTGTVSGDSLADNAASLGCGLVLSLADNGAFSTDNAGNSWSVDVTAAKDSDTLTVGNLTYSFTDGPGGSGRISAGADTDETARNIAAALGSHPSVSAAAVGSDVEVEARIAGIAGNNIVLRDISDFIDTPAIGHLEGGSDRQMTVTVNDKRDKARNAVIQVNFDEAVNPLTVSGEAADVGGYIRVVNADASADSDGAVCEADSDCLSYSCNADSGTCEGDFLDGKYAISNQYRTVEFVTKVVCGVNSCGEDVYCLPENSNLRVELTAAQLASCLDITCASRSPYTDCVGDHCHDGARGINLPYSSLMDGVVDMAMNSLDGNRDNNAQGPETAFNLNEPDPGEGDNFEWSFFINDSIDLTSPVMIQTRQVGNLGVETDLNHNSANANLENPILLYFSKVMMSDSLKSGSLAVIRGGEEVRHPRINIWSLADAPVGYWVKKADIDNSPPDGEPESTQAILSHSTFPDSTLFRTQAGSGVKDIYQNCYRPSSGPGCDGSPSCCGGVPTNDPSCP